MRPGDRIANRFEVVARAGSGGMGVVYRANDLETGAEVAVKLLNRELSRDAYRFDQEAKLLSQFDHPHIVRYVTNGFTMDGSRYLVMEWVEGQTLAERMLHQGLTMAETVAMARRVAEAIAFAHARWVVHRDIKPTNILFPAGEVDRVKVIDFGIALRTQVQVRFTESGTILGTPSYMAPEQARASRSIDARCDVFSLGCVLYECLTGQVAFAGSNPLAVRAKALILDPPPVREVAPAVPEALDELVAQMLEKDPVARPPDAAAVARTLAELTEVPAGRAVRRRVDEASTLMVRKSGARRTALRGAFDDGATEDTPPRVAVILGAIPAEYASLGKNEVRKPEEVQAALEAAVAPYDGRVELLADRSIMVIFKNQSGDRSAHAASAAEAALAIRTALPELALVLAVGEDVNLQQALDRGARTMELVVRRALLDRGLSKQPVSAGGIRIDAGAAELLGADYSVIKTDTKSFYLDGRK